MSGLKLREQAAGEGFAVVEQAFEGDGAGGWAVVEEDGDGAAFVELDEVGLGGVDGGVGGFDPVGIGMAASAWPTIEAVVGRAPGSWRSR